MQLLDAHEAARRTRAALAYSGLEQAAVAASSGVPLHTIRRIAGTKPRGASMEELWAIADACDIPRAFIEHGFDGVLVVEDRDAVVVELQDRMEATQQRVDELRGQMSALLEVLVPAAGGEPSEAERATVEAARALFAGRPTS